MQIYICWDFLQWCPSQQDEEAGEGGWFWNEQVGSFRPPGALYCRECGVLIQDYDHL